MRRRFRLAVYPNFSIGFGIHLGEMHDGLWLHVWKWDVGIHVRYVFTEA